MGQQISSWALWHGAALKIIFEASEPDFFHFEGQQSSKCQIPVLGFFLHTLVIVTFLTFPWEYKELIGLYEVRLTWRSTTEPRTSHFKL